MQGHRPSPAERLQDWLMLRLMDDPSLRTGLLRFVDVLASLRRDPWGTRTASLFEEYFDGDFSHLPRSMRLAIRLARSKAMPAPVLAAMSRGGTRLVAGRFIVDPGRGAVDRAVRRLARQGRYPSFDILGEEIVSEAEAGAYVRGYMDLLERLGRHSTARKRTPEDRPCLEVSLKLSSLTPQFNPADPPGTLRRVRPRLEDLCAAAWERGIGVTIDAEQYETRDLAWHICRKVLARGEPLGNWPDIGVVVQAYLGDASRHAAEVIAFSRERSTPLRVRLVKGAYWDFEAVQAEQNGWNSPVLRDKAATDLSFERLVDELLPEPHVRLAVGSHNIRSHARAQAARESLGLPEATLEHQTLNRTLEPLSIALARMGWTSRDYIPAGELIPGMGYLVRRVLENTSQTGFLTRTRVHTDAEELLQPPKLTAEDSTYRRPEHPTGFRNTPPARLFDSAERDRFGEALRSTRAGWGATHLLELGDERLVTENVAVLLSPSDPDPSRPLGRVHLAGLEETARTIALANAAAPRWASVPLPDRVAVSLRAAALLLQRKHEAAAWVVHEGGRSWPDALADIEEAIDHMDWNARQLQRLAPLVETAFRPRGVVACIPPWNFPAALAAGMMSAALVTGNAVILKSAEATPVVAQLLVDVFHKAGVPKEALVYVPGRGDLVGAKLVESPDVDMVAFTGSKRVGKWVYETASRTTLTRGGVKRAVTEMGGKNAIIVFPDADLDEAVAAIIRSAFSHAGQKCSACSRVLAHREVHERLASRLVEAARGLLVGPADDAGTFINPVISEGARGRILEYGNIAREEGRVLLDMLETPKGTGWLLGPMIVEVDARQAMTARIAQEEVFGPILTLVPFDSEQEAVAVANSPVYALTLGIFSRSPKTAQRMARACRAGNIYVNRGITGARVGIEPFGGFQLSGTGPKAGGEDYLMAFLTRRSVHRKHHPLSVHVGATGWSPAGETSPPSRLSAIHPLSVDGEGAWGEVSLRPWDSVPPAARLWVLEEAARLLGADATGNTSAGKDAFGMVLNARVLNAVSEIMEPQPTVTVPGQRNHILNETPRGLGIVAADEGAQPGMLAALAFAALLAGNGIVLWVPDKHRPAAEALVGALWRAGVPRNALAIAPEGFTAESLAAGVVHFAAVDLDLEGTRSVYRVLGVTREEASPPPPAGDRPVAPRSAVHPLSIRVPPSRCGKGARGLGPSGTRDEAPGQRWLKALIDVNDGLRPGEPGFVRQFALAKTIAYRTLHHGAELG